MAKKSIISREHKRSKLVSNRGARRAELNKKAKSLDLTFDELKAVQRELQKMPRDTNPVRGTKRCRKENCGRPHAVYNKVGLCRIHFREYALLGFIPGVHKDSW